MTNIEKLNRYANFEENWNGYGAEKFSAELLDEVKTILSELNEVPFVSPLPYNAVQIEYEKENGDYIEFEISEDDMIKCFSTDSSGHDREFEIKKSSMEINKELNRFFLGLS